MSVTVCPTPAALFQEESAGVDTWSALIKIQFKKAPARNVTAPYIHPLMRRSSNLMSKSSLEMCTESLGSETGSCDFSDNNRSWLNSDYKDDGQVILKHEKRQQQRFIGGEDDGNQLISASYHCPVRRRSPVSGSFPPPLPSISNHDGACMQMRSCRHDGRLVLDKVPVASQNYLPARRHEGHIHLSFIGSSAISQPTKGKTAQKLLLQMVKQAKSPSKEINHSGEEAEDEDEHEEEVEVLDKGTNVELKLSSQPQHYNGPKMVLRSSLVMNKFVAGTPLTNQNRWVEPAQEKHHHSVPFAASQHLQSPKRRLTATTSTTTAAAAAVAASSEEVGQHKSDSKVLFTSKQRNRYEMLHHMRRYSELRRPPFFWEADCIPTSS